MSLGLLMKDYCNLLVMSCFLDFSCTLEFCVVIFTFADTSSNFTAFMGKYHFSVLLQILRLSQTLGEYTCSTLLAPSCG